MILSKEDHIETLTKTLHLNYDVPEEFAKDLAEFLYEEGYRKLVEAKWIKLRMASIVCSSCGYMHNHPNSRSEFCPKCGAQMSKED